MSKPNLQQLGRHVVGRAHHGVRLRPGLQQLLGDAKVACSRQHDSGHCTAVLDCFLQERNGLQLFAMLLTQLFMTFDCSSRP